MGLPDPVALLQMFSSVEFFRPRSVRVRCLSVSGEQKDNSSSLLMNCILFYLFARRARPQRQTESDIFTSVEAD